MRCVAHRCSDGCGVLHTGAAMGAVSLAAPLYIAEVSSKAHRGALGAAFQLLVTIGILSVYALGLTLRWDWLALVGVGVAALGAALLLVVPESPVWLAAHGDLGLARRALAWLSLNVDHAELEASQREGRGGGGEGGFRARYLLERGV